MLRKISIKCIDGSRFDIDATGYQFNLDDAIASHFLMFNIDGGTKSINVDNIVSITDTVIDDGKA